MAASLFALVPDGSCVRSLARIEDHLCKKVEACFDVGRDVAGRFVGRHHGLGPGVVPQNSIDSRRWTARTSGREVLGAVMTGRPRHAECYFIGARAEPAGKTTTASGS